MYKAFSMVVVIRHVVFAFQRHLLRRNGSKSSKEVNRVVSQIGYFILVQIQMIAFIELFLLEYKH